MKTLHPRAFGAAVVWTLGLLFLGSLVHATESSLACPDWPTCFGTMVPEMSGGVFWEHLHRLVAGGLLLLWGLGTWLAWREEGARRWVFRSALAGVGLLLVQSLFGGLTVIFRLPDLVSTTHLTLAFGFLALATFMASRTAWSRTPTPDRKAQRWATVGALTVMAQSILGALVRHTDAGMACPDVPLCLGSVIPPLESGLVTLHFLHRVLALVTAGVVTAGWWRARSSDAHAEVRAWAGWAAVLVAVQIGLGLLSVMSALAVVPVSLHTLVAATLLVSLVHLATLTRTAEPATVTDPRPAHATQGT